MRSKIILILYLCAMNLYIKTLCTGILFTWHPTLNNLRACFGACNCILLISIFYDTYRLIRYNDIRYYNLKLMCLSALLGMQIIMVLNSIFGLKNVYACASLFDMANLIMILCLQNYNNERDFYQHH